MKTLLILLLTIITATTWANPRERLLMDFDWKFAFGHPYDKSRDFETGTAYFSYLAKAGNGDGAASANFDDRAWRKLDLPHDWAVEAPFSKNASHSHGYKAVGPGFPESSVGWYRKTFHVPATDKGKRISIEFDGVSRDAQVWVNGFYCGHESSGYYSFSFDVTEYLNFGGDNVVSVRCDVSLEEGWYYEGAGIYRHVWLTKTAPLHVPKYGTFVSSVIVNNEATVTAKVKVLNKHLKAAQYQLKNIIVDDKGTVLATSTSNNLTLGAFNQSETDFVFNLKNPRLWSLTDPYLHKLVTIIYQNNQVVDSYETTFGIRSIRFDANKGFFLNNQHVKLKGTNNHQDHAGVGVAMPDGLQEYRIKQLKAMGSNAYRCSHNPPTPELLDACDRLGMLVINENRLMGVTQRDFSYLERLIVRDRNHPSVILWSIGNEEWAIEGTEKGAAIALTMQAFVKTIDTTRMVNAAISGGWSNGIGSVIETMGYNYLRHGDTDDHHAKFPWQPSMGTEEGSTNTTRGIYFDDEAKQYLAAYDRPTPSGFLSIQQGWKHYAERDYLAGMFIWTGFDYKGEPTPYGFPSVGSYFGMLDACGFPKDNVYYLQSWWGDKPVLHILPHWNWQGREGQSIDVWVYSNHHEVELFFNKKSLGKKVMPKNGHLSWPVKYSKGTLTAVGYRHGKKVQTKIVSTTGKAANVQLVADANTIKGNKEDIAVVTVQIADNNGMVVPDANHLVKFSISGPAKIIGVGNGDPTSLENDKFVETVKTLPTINWQRMLTTGIEINSVIKSEVNDIEWQNVMPKSGLAPGSKAQPTVFKGVLQVNNGDLDGKLTWMYKSIGHNQRVYINGELLNFDFSDNAKFYEIPLKTQWLKPGENTLHIVAEPFVLAHIWDNVNLYPGEIQLVKPALQWQRSTFNGYAQIILQSTGGAGSVVLTAEAEGLKPASLVISATNNAARPHVASR